MRDAKESASGGAGAQELIDAVMTRILIAVFVYMTGFAVTPYTSLVSVNLRYTPLASLANPTPTTGSLNTGTGSSYDNALRDARDGAMSPSGGLSYVPAWWFTVMSISSGINNAVRRGGHGQAGRLLFLPIVGMLSPRFLLRPVRRRAAS